MKKLNLVQMQNIVGGIKTDSMIGLMCGVTLAFACSTVLAPFAAATGVGCAVGLYALHVWAN